MLLVCPRNYLDAVDGARTCLRAAREMGMQRLKIQLPILPPETSLEDALKADGAAFWPGGVAQSHRKGLQPLMTELTRGYDAEFCGMIDSPSRSLGVWRLAGGSITAVSNVADLSFETFASLCDGEFGSAPTRSDHTLLLINPRLTNSRAIGQPWQRSLRRRAVELIDDAGWVWAYRCRPVPAPDGITSLGVAVSTELDVEFGGREGAGKELQTSCVCADGELLAATTTPAQPPYTSRAGIIEARSMLVERRRRQRARPL